VDSVRGQALGAHSLYSHPIGQPDPSATTAAPANPAPANPIPPTKPALKRRRTKLGGKDDDTDDTGQLAGLPSKKAKQSDSIGVPARSH
jgi:hypothetical protein